MADRSKRSDGGQFAGSWPDRLMLGSGLGLGLMLAPSNPEAAGAALVAGALGPWVLGAYRVARPVARGIARAYRYTTLAPRQNDE